MLLDYQVLLDYQGLLRLLRVAGLRRVTTLPSVAKLPRVTRLPKVPRLPRVTRLGVLIYPQPVRRHYHPKYTLIMLAHVSYFRSLVVRAVHQHRTGVGSIPAGGPYS